ncbi:MAG: hypothetical protein JNK21_03830 [Rhodospirillaceae bacterium]|nr:hypothetical protein [Rhodospirillaceae bacterium]
MSETAAGTTPDAPTASWYRQPYVGLLAMAAVLTGIAIGHAILVLMRHLLGADDHHFLTSEIVISLVMGCAGMTLVWTGRDKGEGVGTWLGFIAGTLIWIGFFELAWKAFAIGLSPQPVMYEGIPVLSAELQVIQASSIGFFMMMAFLTINRETRCNMMVWIRRKLGLDPGKAITNRERNFAALTASESYMTTWACYIITIMLVDPRIIGNPMGLAAQLPYLGIFVWGIYLVYRITKQRQMAPALRYAIGAGNVNWIWIEAGSRAELYEEIWIKPTQYPLTMSLMAVALAAALAVMLKNRGPNRNAAALEAAA